MMPTADLEIERKIVAILKVLSEFSKPPSMPKNGLAKYQ